MVGQHEEPLALVRRAELRRAEQTPLRIEPERGKVGKHVGEPKAKMAGDVFEEDQTGLALSDDSSDVRPEVARVVFAALVAGDAERLARVTGRDEIHSSTPRCAVEGGQVVPDRRAIQGRVFHPRHESGRCVAVPLNMTHGAVVVSEGESEPEVDASDAGTKSQAIHAIPANVHKAARRMAYPLERWSSASCPSRNSGLVRNASMYASV